VTKAALLDILCDVARAEVKFMSKTFEKQILPTLEQMLGKIE
jgi:hypothetical protein